MSAPRSSVLARIDQLCDRYENARLAGQRPYLEDYLREVPEVERSKLFRELLKLDLHYRRQQRETPTEAEYCQPFPQHSDLIHAIFHEQSTFRERQSPHAESSLRLEAETGAELTDPMQAKSPERVGRYRITARLGSGSFGVVYRAYDEELQRDVAIKVPHRKHLASPSDIEAYLAEARVLASLEHPHIVSVYDFGRTDDGLCYVVSKYVAGTDLATRIEQTRSSAVASAALVATVAEALHHAHRNGVVHRDIKPANILLDTAGEPYVADFGLALKEEDFGRGTGFAGTPAYMSPEQARSEGHRVDGRSDIFSLGIIFYELLTGRRPFRGETISELLERITSVEARPPRQIDDRIPRELERICLKALSKRASERYTTAKDMGDDLRHFLAASSAEDKPASTGRERHQAEVGTPLLSALPTALEQQVVKIVPKGLRAFDASDADFFLELLPGPRDRDGLPDSLRFWKSRIEEADPDSTFAVGLIYGPSGCGKSSLVKAGLLPRLARSVKGVSVEATGAETEARLLKGLRRQVAELPGNKGLIESLAALRKGRYLESGQKVLLVLDQFEQWLHAKRSDENTELVQALRQCDGGRLQALVMVRDDFWLAVSRFMQALEVRVLEGGNSRLVDLFDLRHAKKILTVFGRAFGALPERELIREEGTFLDQAVVDLSQDDKVIPVRLALFAEMVKGKPWTPATLREVGGTEGVGVAFLEETFTASTAPLQHRLHQKAAQAVLKALLPESGTDIKGHMRSQQELLEASGYTGRPRDFDDLRHVLDSELRLITPTDPEGKDDSPPSTVPAGAKYYQLTHDYLVLSLRDWLTRKQKETRRGRAELLLADRAAVWNARPEKRQLPSLLQWLQIRWLTARKKWTPPQHKMMRKAARIHTLRGMVVGLLFAVATATGLMVREHVVERGKAAHAAGLVHSILNADTSQVPAVIDDLSEYRQWADPLLREENDKAAVNSRKKLHISLALLPVDDSQVKYLTDRLLGAEAAEVSVIRDALIQHRDQLVNPLWAVVEAPVKGKESQRLRAAAALAKYDPESEKWAKAHKAIGNDLVAVQAVYLSSWMDALRPVRTKLVPQLSEVYSEASRGEMERSLAADILADYAADDPQVLADLLMNADEKQFAVIDPKLRKQGEKSTMLLTAEIEKKLPPGLASSDDKREKLAKRQANAAVALLRMNRGEKVWPLLRRSDRFDDPRLRSYLLHRLAPLGVDATAIVKKLDGESNVTIRRALVLSLGEYSAQELTPDTRKTLVPKLQALYRRETDSGLHSALEWVLRKWKEEAWLKQVNEEWAKDKKQREKRLEEIKQFLAKEKEKTGPQWYVHSRGLTMVVIPGPVTFMMGSPLTEAGIADYERQHKKRIGRSFALAVTSVTLEQYRLFDKDYHLSVKYTPKADLPVVGTSWHQAAAYCNWLSKEEGIDEDQWCYEIKDGQVTKLKENYLSRTGYRLPTEAELEYATRAGALTSRYWGETEELMPKYAWYMKNSEDRAWPVGMLKPNDFGLFDSQGNVFTWCQERFKSYPSGPSEQADEDKEDIYNINAQDNRSFRGGSFSVRVSVVRSADRDFTVPASRLDDVGLRPARTFR